MIGLHGALALIRLRLSPDAAPLAQLFTDTLFRFLDSGLREAGVGDLSVPKRMRRLAGDFYGRLDAYAAGLAEGGDLGAALGRNILGDEAAAFAPVLAAYARAVSAQLAAAPTETLAGPAAWMAPVA